MLGLCEMGNIKASMQMLAMFGLIVIFHKVGVNVVQRRHVVDAFAQEAACFDFREHRFPVMMWVREASVVEQWTRVSVFTLNGNWHFTTFRGIPNG